MRVPFALALVAWLTLAAPAALGERTDVIVLFNGDHFTGEIMSLSRGKLDYKTDDAGRLSIEWLKVVRATSTHIFEIETSNGDKYHSAFLSPPEGETGVVLLDDGTKIPISDVVSLVRIDEGLVSRLQAYLDVGFTLAKANTAVTLTSDGLVGYRGERMGSTLEFDVYSQNTDNSVSVNRDSIKLTGDLYFERWAAQLFLSAEHNDELDLKLRVTLGGGAMYWAVRSNLMELAAKAGLAGLREAYTSGDPAYYLTGYVNGSWDVFQYDSPKLDFGISVTAYPYLTDLGRVRLEGSLRIKYEIFKDFNVGLSFSDTFDSRPPDTTASKNDFITSLTIGWTYHR